MSSMSSAESVLASFYIFLSRLKKKAVSLLSLMAMSMYSIDELL